MDNEPTAQRAFIEIGDTGRHLGFDKRFQRRICDQCGLKSIWESLWTARLQHFLARHAELLPTIGFPTLAEQHESIVKSIDSFDMEAPGTKRMGIRDGYRVSCLKPRLAPRISSRATNIWRNGARMTDISILGGGQQYFCGEGPVWDSRTGILHRAGIVGRSILSLDPVRGKLFQTATADFPTAIGLGRTPSKEVVAFVEGIKIREIGSDRFEPFSFLSYEPEDNRLNEGAVSRMAASEWAR